ncbi:MAG: hypothetical protein COA73_07955 [Candidatus Hydrogenedentota bacterium]|nr:MAG: hypothetical protein COA73_07955 [Candidatus Hydrogenedentota bacterium]
MGMNANVEKIISKIGDLPAIPEIVNEVLSLTQDPHVSVSDVSNLIEKDPALAAKLLKVSNSSYYGMRQVVGTLKLALVILGIKEVRNIVLGISVLDTLKDPELDTLLDKEGLWDHSTQVASLAKKFGTFLEINLQGEDFVSGLLHDIGKMVLWKSMKSDYSDIYYAAKSQGVSLSDLEYENFGFDHADVGGVLANTWNLPASLCDALWYHHPRSDRPLNEAKDPKLAALVRVSNYASNEDWNFDWEVDEKPDPNGYRSCADEEVWYVLQDGRDFYDLDKRFDILSGFMQEIQVVPALAI